MTKTSPRILKLECVRGEWSSLLYPKTPPYAFNTTLYYTSSSSITSWSLARSRWSYLSWHFLCSLRLQLLQSLVPLVFHYSPLLEIGNLIQQSALDSLLYCRAQRTQLDAQFVSNPLPSAAQAFPALSFSVMLSTILFLSRHEKYASLASQHLALSLRSGAMRAPSDDTL